MARSAPRELAEIGPNWPNLQLLAQSSGGRIASAQAVADLARRLAAAGRTDLWPFLLAAAAALMLADWAIARIWHRKGGDAGAGASDPAEVMYQPHAVAVGSGGVAARQGNLDGQVALQVKGLA